MKNKICIINTGGTISMKKSKKGYIPGTGYVEEVLKKNSLFQHPDLPKFDVIEYQPLLDSSNMHFDNWNQIAGDIKKHYHQYNGFVILHGTDTMSYTASALSFMLENLAKPVILTGSQLPLAEVRNDAQKNLLHAMILAGHYPIPEVCVYFNDVLLRGNRSQKIHTHHFAAFASPRFPILARLGIDIEIFSEYWLSIPKKEFKVHFIHATEIAVVHLFPGMPTTVLDHLFQAPLKGLILETFGTGNAPNNNQAFFQALKKAANKNMILVNCTQCHQGRVNMHHYATGVSLSNYMISGFDMTIEAAMTKLSFLLNQNFNKNKIEKLMQQSLRGELTTHEE